MADLLLALQSTLSITLPGAFTVHFQLDPLERESAAILSTQLITPLLGLSASLLGLLKDEISDPSALVAKVQGAIDGSGTAEYNQEGRACNTLFRIGGSSMLKRWTEKSARGSKAKELSESFCVAVHVLLQLTGPFMSYSTRHAITSCNLPLPRPFLLCCHLSRRPRLLRTCSSTPSFVSGQRQGTTDAQP